MKTALLCWELGTGLGHLTPIKQMSEELVQRGYQVWIAARELHNIHHVFNDINNKTNIKIIQAPVNRNDIRKAVENTLCFADLLHHIGYKNKESLANHIHSWQSLFELIKPDIMFFDHSPTAIIASRGTSAKKVLMGTPFSRPPEETTFKGVFAFYNPAKTEDLPRAKKIEQQTLDNINYACERNAACRKNLLSPLEKIADIFSPIDYELFSCLKEFDHFPSRPKNDKRFYLSTAAKQSGIKPEWPSTDSKTKKIFCYLKAQPNIISVINALIASKQSSIIYVAGQFELKQSLPSYITIINHPLSMKDVFIECDLVITNGNLNTVQQGALAGLPQLTLPIQLEQLFLMHKLQRQEIIERLDDRSPQHTKDQIIRLMNDDNLKIKALKEKYKNINSEHEVRNIFDTILKDN